MAGPLWDLAIGWSGSFAYLYFEVSEFWGGGGQTSKWANVLCSANDVAPVDTDLVSSLYVNHPAGGGGVRIASKVSVVYVGDGVVGWRNADTDALTKVLAVDSNALGNGMG